MSTQRRYRFFYLLYLCSATTLSTRIYTVRLPTVITLPRHSLLSAYDFVPISNDRHCSQTLLPNPTARSGPFSYLLRIRPNPPTDETSYRSHVHRLLHAVPNYTSFFAVPYFQTTSGSISVLLHLSIY